MPKTDAVAVERCGISLRHCWARDTMAVISRLVVGQRLCDKEECGKPLQTVLQCAKCKGVAYCSKDCQVFQYHHTLLAH